MNLRSTALAESRSMALARRSSLVRRSCSTPHKRSTRPLACGLLAAMKVTLSCSKARPNWVGWRFPASCPVVIVADEDAAVIAVKSQRHAETAQQLAQQAEIAKRGFRREELCGQDFPGGVILHAESGELRAASFEPIVRAAVELHEFAEPRGAHAALTMSGSTTLARRPATVQTQECGGSGTRHVSPDACVDYAHSL